MSQFKFTDYYKGLSLKAVIFLLFFISSFAHAEDKPAIGQVISTVGKVKAVNSEKGERELKRGDSFYTLEKILVDVASKIQLKFIDGGIINLIASSEYQVDSYTFKDSKEKPGSLSTLAKGGFRAISGSIGKDNPDAVKIKTPVATIGLRGTTYKAVLENGQLSVGCEYGTVVVSNDQGEVNIGPTSDTLYSTVAENQAPAPSVEEPADLASTSFAVEGGESFGAEPGEEDPSVGAENEEEPISSDSEEENAGGTEEEISQVEAEIEAPEDLDSDQEGETESEATKPEEEAGQNENPEEEESQAPSGTEGESGAATNEEESPAGTDAGIGPTSGSEGGDSGGESE